MPARRRARRRTRAPRPGNSGRRWCPCVRRPGGKSSGKAQRPPPPRIRRAAPSLRMNTIFGTHDQCRSQNFQKTVRYLSEICQKTVSYKNQSENSKKCVRYKSENCQLQISVRTLLENIWNCIRNVSDFINESENCQWFISRNIETLCKTVRNISGNHSHNLAPRRG